MPVVAHDPALARRGARHRRLRSAARCYVETFWLPTLGPTALLLLRHLADAVRPQPARHRAARRRHVARARRSASATATARRSSARSRGSRQFDLACSDGRGTVAVRRNLPPVNRRHLRRLPGDLQADARRVDRGAARRAAARRPRAATPGALALTLLEQGDDRRPRRARARVRWASTPPSATTAPAGRRRHATPRRGRAHSRTRAGRSPHVGRRAARPAAARRTILDDAIVADLRSIASACGRADRRAHRRRDLDRVGHPRLPRPAGRLDEEPRRPRRPRRSSTTSPTPRSASTRGRTGSTARCGTPSPTPGTTRSPSSSRRARAAHARHPERRRAAPRRRDRRRSGSSRSTAPCTRRSASRAGGAARWTRRSTGCAPARTTRRAPSAAGC